MGADNSVPVKVGEGGFGCVFRPAMTCIDGSRKKGKFITKVTDRKVIADTIKKNNLLKGIKSNLEISDISSCELSERSLNQARRQCDNFRPGITIYGLNIPDIGDASLKDLDNIEDSFIDFFEKISMNDFIGLVIRLAYDIEYINYNDIFHLDIKEDNILLDIVDVPQLRLIDFDLLNKFSFENPEILETIRNHSRLSRPYFTPPELIFSDFLPRVPENTIVDENVFNLDTMDSNSIVYDKSYGAQHIVLAYFFKLTTTYYFLKKHTYSPRSNPSFFTKLYDFIERNDGEIRNLIEENMVFLKGKYVGEKWEVFIGDLLESWDAFGYGVAMISFLDRVKELIWDLENIAKRPIISPEDKRKLDGSYEILQTLVCLKLKDRLTLKEVREQLLEIIS